MVVACRGDGVELVGVNGAGVISLREAAGPPEGGKVLGRGSAPMEAVLSIGPYDAEHAAGVTFPQVYRCFVPVQDAAKVAGTEGELAAVSRGATRAVTRGREVSGGAVEIY